MIDETPIPHEYATRIYDILVAEAGASDNLREGDQEAFGMSSHRWTFYWYMEPGQTREYRFGGHLGFGGKFWNHCERWYVNAYPEDVQRDPKIGPIIESVNAQLAALNQEWKNTR